MNDQLLIAGFISLLTIVFLFSLVMDGLTPSYVEQDKITFDKPHLKDEIVEANEPYGFEASEEAFDSYFEK